MLWPHGHESERWEEGRMVLEERRRGSEVWERTNIHNSLEQRPFTLKSMHYFTFECTNWTCNSCLTPTLPSPGHGRYPCFLDFLPGARASISINSKRCPGHDSEALVSSFRAFPFHGNPLWNPLWKSPRNPRGIPRSFV